MNAHEVIDQIKALAPEERAKVIEFLEAMKTGQQKGLSDDKSFAATADWVFKEHAELMRKLSQ